VAQETSNQTLVKSFGFYADLLTNAGRLASYKEFENIANSFFEINQQNSNITLQKFEQFIKEKVKRKDNPDNNADAVEI
jgi:hypothetical protein